MRITLVLPDDVDIETAVLDICLSLQSFPVLSKLCAGKPKYVTVHERWQIDSEDGYFWLKECDTDDAKIVLVCRHPFLLPYLTEAARLFELKHQPKDHLL